MATVYGIGVGPGDPELLTLKGLRLLQACPVIAYPAPETGESLARRIAAPHISGTKTEIAIRMPLRADRFPAQEVYDRAAIDIGSQLSAGHDVAVLCLGDPFFYGSFMYLFERLAATASVVVIPGVTSVSAGAAAVGLPLVTRNETLTVIPAPLPDGEIERRLRDSDAAAIVKLGRHFERIRALLQRLGLAAKTRYVEHASMSTERIIPLAAIEADGVPYFSLLLVRKGGR